MQALFDGLGSAADPITLPIEKARQVVELFQEGYALLEQGYTLYVSQLAGHLAAILRHFRLQSQGSGIQHGRQDFMQRYVI